MSLLQEKQAVLDPPYKKQKVKSLKTIITSNERKKCEHYEFVVS